MFLGLQCVVDGQVMRKQTWSKDGVTNYVVEVASFGFSTLVRFESREEWDKAPAEGTPVSLHCRFSPGFSGMYRMDATITTKDAATKTASSAAGNQSVSRV